MAGAGLIRQINDFLDFFNRKIEQPKKETKSIKEGTGKTGKNKEKR